MAYKSWTKRVAQMNTIPNQHHDGDLAAVRQPVSSGLNLTLKLQDPTKLRHLMDALMRGQSQLRSLLADLNFVHFARFIPSWDGQAIMVVSEFDGPLEPYVMDFVIALGPAFDMLMSHVDPAIYDHRFLPVGHHPDEFWNFVKEWNRVPYGPRTDSITGFSKAGVSHDVFSAYPDLTVLDIVGKRTQPAVDVKDRPAASVPLDDVQGNVVNGYHAAFGEHLFLTIVDQPSARRWLASEFAEGLAGPGNWGGLRSAATWDKRPSVMANVAFTHAGLLRLLPDRADDLGLFPEAFRMGSHERAGINGDVGSSGPEHWRFGRDDQDIHVVISLHAFREGEASTGLSSGQRHVLDTLRSRAGANGLLEVGSHPTQSLPFDHVFFGYKDSIAEPQINGLHCKPDHQPKASPGEFLLGSAYPSIYGGPSLGKLPPDLAENGTFGVMRLIEQDVETFNEMLTKQSAELGIDRQVLKAKLMGRWPCGHALSLDPQSPSAGDVTNDFDYAPTERRPTVFDDHDGERCPVGSHVRRVNPRSARVVGQRNARRLIRRGMPSTWQEGKATKKGMLGLFLGASIERQFEFIQQHWIQGDLAASGIRGTQDPIAGQRMTSVPFQVAKGMTAVIPPLVTIRGSLYLFFPGVAALKGIAGSEPRLPAAKPNEVLPPHSPVVGKPIQGGTGLSGILPLDPAFVANPFPTFARMRAAPSSVVFVKEHNAYWVFRRKEVVRLFNERLNFAQEHSEKDPRGLLTLDGERHAVVRKHVIDAFTEVQQRLQTVLEGEIRLALERLHGHEAFDFMTEVGEAIPKRVFLQLFGPAAPEVVQLDAVAQVRMRHFGQPAGRHVNDADVEQQANHRLATLLKPILADAKAQNGTSGNPYDGTLIGEIARRTGTAPELISGKEALVTLGQLAAVHKSAQFLMGSAALNLLKVGASGMTAWAELANAVDQPAFPAQLALALDEARRFDPPVTIVQRYAAQDVRLGPIDIKKDQRVFAVVASANRDGEPSEDLERFIWNRPARSHFSLGHGVHECIGRTLQDAIVAQGLTSMIKAFPRLRLQDPSAAPDWIDNVYFRSLLSLPVEI